MAGPQRADAAGNAFDLIDHGPMGANLLRNADPALRARIQAAAEAGDRRELLKILSQNTNLTTAPQARPRDMPYDMPATSGRDPMPVGERLAQDPNITETVRQGFGPIADIPGMRLDAYGRMADAGGAEELLNLLGRSAPPSRFSVMDLLPDNRPLFSANTGLGGGGSSMDVMPGAGIPSSPGTGLIPSGPRGLSAGGGGGLIVPPGRGLTTTGGPRELAAQGMESPAPRGLPAPNQPRLEGPGQRRIEGPNQPRLDSPDVVAERRAMEELEDAVNANRPRSGGGSPPGRKPPGRNAQPPGPSGPRKRNLLGAAAAAAGGAAAWKLGMDLMFPPGDKQSSIGDGEMSTADLAAETSPPPSVMTEEPAPISPRDQAHALQRKLNEMRAAAGGEVPEAQAMRREIQRLFGISDAQANAAGRTGKVDPAPTNNPLQQARSILAALNSGSVPANQRASMQAEMQRLYRLADEQANARTAAPRRAG